LRLHMDNNMYQDEFEQFLQDEVKQHRMYPSDHIWKNIRTELHGYKAWPALTFISLFIITALTVSTLLNNHPGPSYTRTYINHSSSGNPQNHNGNTTAREDYVHQIAPGQITATTFAGMNSSLPEENILVTRNAAIDQAATTVKSALQPATYTAKAVNKLPAEMATVHPALIENNVTLEPVTAAEPTENTVIPETAATATENDTHTNADDFVRDFVYVNNQIHRKNSKFGFQFYVTPSTSYRKLSDQKVKDIIQPAAAAASSSPSQNVPLSPNLAADVNHVVRHKPAMGFEIGFAVLYNMSDRLKFKTGAQLNVRQYYIETFQSLTNDLTSLALINYGGIETINFYSPWNNNTGYKKTQLDNKVYQIAVPLGIQWDLIRGKHFGITTEASVQPTLTLNNNTYLLSTDYKHYTGGGDFIRKWNINTSVGFNLSYTSGSSSWQIGPQIRYQHLPTYSNQYPIKEYLMDYGVRLGFTRQIK
jgi:hypothetical protein